jgi:hypothetical protein
MIDFTHERLHKVKYYARRADITKKLYKLANRLNCPVHRTQSKLIHSINSILARNFSFFIAKSVKGLTNVPEPWGTTPNQYIQVFRGLPRKHIMYICQ